MKKLISLFTIIIFLGACAHHRDVRPGVGGRHMVKLSAEDTYQGNRSAIKQAQHYCEEKQKEAVFVKEKDEYTGDMEEKDYIKAKRITKVIKGVGGAVGVLGHGRGARTAGGVLGIGGESVDRALGDGYTVEMQFQCQ